MEADGMAMVHVDTEQHLRILRGYRKLLQSTIGPNGSCKAIVTGGGYLEYSSSSASLLARLELASPVCRYINNMAAELADHGLYCGVLLSHILEQQWQECTTSKTKNTQIITDLVHALKTFLLSENVCLKLDFGSVQNILPLVRTVFSSKCPVYLSGMDVEKLCIETIKVFLTGVDQETNLINRVFVKVESGSNFITSYKGLLYTVTDSYNIEIAKQITGEVKLLLFVLKLDGNDDMISQVKQILTHAQQSGVKVVACQKTITPEIKLYLRRNNMVLLERLGSDFTQTLVNMSQAFPISQLNIEDFELVNLTGHLSLIEHVQFNECDYLSLHNYKRPVGTLLVRTATLLGENHVKTLIQQALAALRSVAVCPQLTLGGGCLECLIIGYIHRLKESRREKEFNLVSTWIQKAFQSTISVVEIDNVFHHGWRVGRNMCGCGMVGRGDVEQGRGDWWTLKEVVESQVSLGMPRQPDMTLHSHILVEAHQQKLQVICSVFEAFVNLSDIGLIVQPISNH